MGGAGRRRWTIEAKRGIVEETRAPGCSVSVVARRHDLNANLLFKWKRQDKAEQLSGPLAPTAASDSEFVPIGVVGRACDGGPALLARMPDDPLQRRGPNGSDQLQRPSALEARMGVIEIDLPAGARVRVDALVDARALARVLSALKRHA